MSPLQVNLCFHGVGEPARELEPGEEAYWIGAQLFHDVLDLVVDDPRVRLSFDDGNASDVVLALPALQERGLGATFFVLAGRLGESGSLSTHDVRALHEAGMVVGSHGMTHTPWRGLSGTSLDHELVEARQLLAEVVGAPVDEAALPLGRYDRRLLARVRSLGYRRLHTSDRQPARAGAWLQPRYSVRRHDTVDSVRREVLGRPALSRRATRSAVIAAKRWR